MVFLLVLSLAFIAALGVWQAKNITDLKTEIADLNKEKESYTPTLAKIAKLKKDRQEFERRSQIIDKLKTDSSLTVRVLDEVANRVDNQRMWLDSLHQQQSSLRLSGVALDNQTIAQFMDALKESPFVQDVSLANSSLKVVSGKNLKYFELNCDIAQPAAQQEKSATAN